MIAIGFLCELRELCVGLFCELPHPRHSLGGSQDVLYKHSNLIFTLFLCLPE